MTHRIGIIGAGMIAAYHLAAIKMLPNAEVVGIMDRGSGRGQALDPELDPRGADDLSAFLARDDIDLVTVASPSGSHLDAAVAAAEAGKHCIVEKPIEISTPRIDQMIAAHESAGTTLGGIFNGRFTETVQLLARAAREGRFGRITFAQAVGPWWRDQSYYSTSNWKGTWALDGGGATMNQGIHAVDLLQWLVAEPVQDVVARIATLAHPGIEVEDTAAATLRFESGALGSIACTTSAWPGHYRSITLAGTEGTAVLADDNFLVWQFAHETPADERVRSEHQALPGEGVGAANPSAGVTAHGHSAVFADFLSALEHESPPTIDGHEARKAVSIIEAMYESARNDGRPVAPR